MSAHNRAVSPALRSRGEEWVCARRLLALIRSRIPEGQLYQRLAAAGVRQRFPSDVEHGAQRWVSLAVADRIITVLLDEPELWHLEPWLAEAYEVESD